MDKRLIIYGRLFEMLGGHFLSKIVLPSCKVRVTYTHGISNARMSSFSNIVQHLNNLGSFLSPEMFFSHLSNNHHLNGLNFLMTFDDGLLSSYEATKKILDPLGIKAIFFIPTAILDIKNDEDMRHFAAERFFMVSKREARSLLPYEYRFMTEEHLKQLSSDGHMICPHTHNHVFLSDINDDSSAIAELIKPKQILENILQKKIEAFSFPVGTEKQVNSFSYNIIRKNYKYCFTALNGCVNPSSNAYYLCRNNIPADATISYIDMVMKGIYDLYYLRKISLLKKTILTEAQEAKKLL